MHVFDWFILLASLFGIIAYGIWKTRRTQDADDFLAGNRDLKWWTIGLSIMATQASAITFLSTPGQAYMDGMQFVQFYFGLPLAMVFLAFFVLPIYYKLNITTAYEYLEKRFDLRMRTLTAILFLIQRGVAAAISIYAPSIILCAVFGWSLGFTNAFMAVFVIAYTALGGSSAVSHTQQLQMSIMLGGLMLAFVMVLFQLPEGIGLSEAWRVAAVTHKTEVVDTTFDWHDRYNIWSGLLGSTFLFLSYFGTDQSQVGRYLSGKTLQESRFGLLFNGLIKIPMQFLVLSVGVMVFVFFQFTAPPLHFNEKNKLTVEHSDQRAAWESLEAQHDSLFLKKKTALLEWMSPAQQAVGDGAYPEQIRALDAQQLAVEKAASELIKQVDPASDEKDKDFIFIRFVLQYLPTGLIGLMLAMIFCASWSTTASELSALSTTTVSDIYRRSLAPGKSDAHYLKAAKIATLIWGIFIVLFASYANLFENLIQAINMVGSIFYGTLLGIFFTAFFLPKVDGSAVFKAAIVAQLIVIFLFFKVDRDAYLWYNPLGCFLVMGLGWILSFFPTSKAQ